MPGLLRSGFFRLLVKIFTVLLILLVVTPWIFSHKSRTYNTLLKLPNITNVCLLGARVFPKGKLSPVVKQRCDALLKLFKRKSYTIIVSGSGKYEVGHISAYLVKNGIPETKLIKDYFGYDTHDSMRFLKKNNYTNVLLITQSFHLFRALEMALDEKLDAYGLRAEVIAPSREDLPFLEKAFIRIKRHLRGSMLFWLYKSGLYDMLSREAENQIKKQIPE